MFEKYIVFIDHVFHQIDIDRKNMNLVSGVMDP